MRPDAVAAPAATPSSLGPRFQAALEASLRPGGTLLPCVAFARQVPAAQQAEARGIDLGNGLSLWHAPWTARDGITTAWLIGPNSVRRLTWLPRVRHLGGAPTLECLLDVRGAIDSLAIVVFTERGDVRLSRLRPPGPAAQLITLLSKSASSAPDLLRDWLSAFKPFLRGAPDAARVLADAERLYRRPVIAATEERKTAAGFTPFGIGIDFALPLPDGSVFAKGWLRDPTGMLAGLDAATAFGTTVSLPAVLCADAEDPERRVFFSRSEPTRDPVGGTQILITARLAGGHSVRLTPPQPFLTPTQGRDLLLRTTPMEALDQPGSTALLDSVLMPALGALQEAHRRGPKVDVVRSIGEQPEQPAWSVVVPLYRNLTFLRHQLAAFGLDPAFRGVELIFVLDSPEQAAEVDRLLRGMRYAFGTSARLVIHTRNFGFAAAINSGVAESIGERVLLLNSDVIPLAVPDGWLARLQAHLDTAGVGVVGPKLLFDDDSLQHAGLHWERDDQGEWYNRHYYKGYPRDFPPACVSREVPAVTGACLAVRRSVFDQVGGVSEDYVIGDYEDSDFCLKVRTTGLSCRYAADVELYHMERQSITEHDAYERTPACLYNRRLHHDRWGATIATLQARFDTKAPTP